MKPLGRPTFRAETTFFQLRTVSATSSPWIELILADGTLIRLPQQNREALLTVLRPAR